jgi:hypothetical protein
LLQRFAQVSRALAQFVEQAHVLDRDDRLIGECRNQGNLLIGKWARLRATDRQAPNGLVFSQ